MKLISKNKQAYHNYEITATREAGIVLSWHEVKAIRWWLVNLTDAYVRVIDGQCWVKQLEIRMYEHASHKQIADYEARSDRKLLLSRREIIKLSERMNRTWLTCVPLEIYITEKQRIKLKIALVKLMRKVDKKQILKEKEVNREASRAIRDYN